MKRFCLLLCLAAMLAISCSKSYPGPVQEPERELSTPEKVEAKLIEIAGRGWEDLIYRLRIYYDFIVKDGNTHGYGPDGNYYDLSRSVQADSSLVIAFSVDYQTLLTASGKINPLSLTVDACDTKIETRSWGPDSLNVSVENIVITAPLDFLSDSLATAPFSFDGEKTGYLTVADYENEDYEVETCLVVHYYGDNRTFAFNAQRVY